MEIKHELLVMGVFLLISVLISSVLLSVITWDEGTNERGSVAFDINKTDNSIIVMVETMGREGFFDEEYSDYIIIGGEALTAKLLVNGSFTQADIVLDKKGETVKLGMRGGEGYIKEEGSISVVSVKGEVNRTHTPVWTSNNSYCNSSLEGVRPEEDIKEDAVMTTIRSLEYNLSG